MTDTNPWKAPEPHLLPDFIIGGAMKCGTSTVHAILNGHPRVSIPERELQFFDMDELVEHGDFNFYDARADRWKAQRLEQDPAGFWTWYHDKFRELPGPVLGEDATGYLGSVHAAERIARQEKPIKMVFLLRHPTARAYSQYFHQLRRGRAMFSFEDALQFTPHSIVPRSLYLEKLRPWYQHLPAERIGVWIFEDLVADPRGVIAEISRFVGIDPTEIPEASYAVHKNPGRIARFLGLQAFTNRVFRKQLANQYSDFLPNPSAGRKSATLGRRIFTKALGIINPVRVSKPPVMNPGTKQFLDDYFRKELAGLDELVGKPVTEKWFPTGATHKPLR